MSELILHQYAGSPFSEKLRLILGFKGLPWAAVEIPVVMPKPDLVALTGGYRRTPVLQIGADIYCDSALAARVIDRLHPQPPLFPPAHPLAPLLAQWADATLFWAVIPYAMQPPGAMAIFGHAPAETMKAFAADRAPFTAGLPRQSPRDAAVALGAYLDRLDAQVAAGGPFLFGASPTIADFSVAHCLWFLRLAGPLAAILDARPALGPWLERLRAFGHGRKRRIDAAEALAVAAAGPHAPVSVTPGLGFEAGAPARVTPIDYGRDPVDGTLVGLDDDEVVLRRHDERAGWVQVHFPRIGFRLEEQR